MQINLPDDIAATARDKALAAGFGEEVAAFVAHLVATHEPEDVGAPKELKLAGRTREQFEAMIEAGYASGPSSPMTDEDWAKLKSRFPLPVDEARA